MRLFIRLWRANPANGRNMALCLSLVLLLCLVGRGADTWRVLPQNDQVAVRGRVHGVRVAAQCAGSEVRRFVGWIMKGW